MIMFLQLAKKKKLTAFSPHYLIFPYPLIICVDFAIIVGNGKR